MTNKKLKINNISEARKKLYETCNKQNEIKVDDLELRPDAFENITMFANGYIDKVLGKINNDILEKMGMDTDGDKFIVDDFQPINIQDSKILIVPRIKHVELTNHRLQMNIEFHRHIDDLRNRLFSGIDTPTRFDSWENETHMPPLQGKAINVHSYKNEIIHKYDSFIIDNKIQSMTKRMVSQLLEELDKKVEFMVTTTSNKTTDELDSGILNDIVENLPSKEELDMAQIILSSKCRINSDDEN